MLIKRHPKKAILTEQQSILTNELTTIAKSCDKVFSFNFFYIILHKILKNELFS